MHFPVYLKLFGLKIHPHLFFESLAYTVGFLVFRLLKKRRGDHVPQSIRWSIIAAAAAGAVIGSKVLYWLEDPGILLAHPDAQTLLGGKSIIGGLTGGMAAVEWVKHQLNFKERTGDLFAVPLCIGIAVGRVGCFLTGLPDKTYGSATWLPWGVDFGDGIRRHPAQLYEIVFLLLFAGALLYLMRRPHLQGDIFKMFMVGYGLWRLAIDFLKPDPAFAGLRSIQWACLLLLLYYSRDIGRWLRRAPGAPEASAAGTT